MEVTGTAIVQRSREALWRVLMDPDVLRRCLPGCEELEEVRPGVFRVRLRWGVGLLKGRFTGDVVLKDLEEPESLRMEISASGSLGVISGINALRLTPLDGGRTELYFRGTGRAEGGLASLGSRLVRGSARSFAEKFFRALSRL